jgi:vacuolar-type H+-ATPase catalytic subunit A/Vma1
MSTSIIEIELLIMLHIDKKFIWWLNLFKKIELSSDQQMTLYNDNFQTIRLLISKIAKVDTKLRYVDVTQCWLREFLQRDILKMNYLLITKMTTDEMMKILSSQKHKKFIKQLNLVNIKNLIEMNDVNDSNWKFVRNRVVINIKRVRCAKIDFSSFRFLDAAAFQSCKHLNI